MGKTVALMLLLFVVVEGNMSLARPSLSMNASSNRDALQKSWTNKEFLFNVIRPLFAMSALSVLLNVGMFFALNSRLDQKSRKALFNFNVQCPKVSNVLACRNSERVKFALFQSTSESLVKLNATTNSGRRHLPHSKQGCILL